MPNNPHKPKDSSPAALSVAQEAALDRELNRLVVEDPSLSERSLDMMAESIQHPSRLPEIMAEQRRADLQTQSANASAMLKSDHLSPETRQGWATQLKEAEEGLTQLSGQTSPSSSRR